MKGSRDSSDLDDGDFEGSEEGHTADVAEDLDSCKRNLNAQDLAAGRRR
jgi:hypothetical protein